MSRAAKQHRYLFMILMVIDNDGAPQAILFIESSFDATDSLTIG